MTPNEQMKRMSRRSFVWALGAVGTTFAGWKWLSSQPLRDGVLEPLRSGLEFNEGVWNALYSTDRLCPTFPASMAVTVPRTNSSIGSRTDEDHSKK